MKYFLSFILLATSMNINAQDSSSSQSGNIIDVLSGKIAGLNIINYSNDPTESNPSMFLNGIRSLYNNNPLILVDGIVYEGDISSLNTNDVENVTVIKDAAGLVKYGNRAQNGVIEITTKNGTKSSGIGLYSGLSRLNFTAKWGVNSNAIGQYDIIKSAAEDYKLRFPDGNGTIGESTDTYDFYDQTFRNSLRQEYNVDYSKVFKKGSLYASAGYLDNSGIIRGNDYDRLTLRINGEYKPVEILTIGMKASLAHNEKKKSLKDDDLTNVQYGAPVFYNYGTADTYIFNGNDKETSTVSTVKLYADIRLLEGLTLEANGTWRTTNPNINIKYAKVQTTPYSWHRTDSANVDYSAYSLTPELKLTWNKEWNVSRLSVQGRFKHYSYNTDYSSYFAENINESSKSMTRSISKGYDEYDAYYGSAEYVFKGLGANASFRRQSSAIMKKAKNAHNWFTNWSAGAKWDICDYVLAESRVIKYLSVIANYGIIGNDISGVSNSMLYYPYNYYLNAYGYRNNPTDVCGSLGASGFDNFDWEKHKIFSAGVDFGLFEDIRLSGTIEFFHNTNNSPYIPSYYVVGAISNTRTYMISTSPIGRMYIFPWQTHHIA